MEDYSRAEAAERAGVSLDDMGPLVDLGVLAPGRGDRFSAGDVRRVALIQGFVAGGIPLDGLAAAMRQGTLSLGFLDSPTFDRFASFSRMTFRELSTRTGVPVELLMVIREAIGAALPVPEDRVREDEMPVVALIQAQVESGFKHAVVERALRAIGDSLRRVTEVESDWFRTEVIAPRMAGRTGAEISAVAAEFNDLFVPLNDHSVLAIYHAQQSRAWTSAIIEDFETLMGRAGLQNRLARLPAMCFLDITGYTRLTQERGDEAAASLAGTLGRLVQRSSVQHGGRPVKWLGDGVMLYFREPGPGVVAALEMIDGIVEAGLPPAHVGLHAGPVVFQEGDYYGQTVNVASRIAEYARPGEVLVSQAVVDAAGGAAEFTEIGPVELKGVAGAMHLHSAHRA